MLKDKNVIIIAHKYLSQPDDDLAIYLNNVKNPSVLHVGHDFVETGTNGGYVKLYEQGIPIFNKRASDIKKLPELLVYIKELFLTLYWVIKYKKPNSIFIGMDGLCVFYGIILRNFGMVENVVYWATDFVPNNRFEQRWKNLIYKTINKLSYLIADQVWDLSPRMRQARKDYLGIKEDAYRNNKLVPYGAWINRIKKYSYDECDKNTLVFMGHLLKKQGVQLVLHAMPELIKRIPDIKFLIIGTGIYENTLKRLATELEVTSHCEFTGKIVDDMKLEDRLAKSCVAIAPYIKELDNWTYYADPGKVKKYLACGLPIVLTGIPWNSQEILTNNCGLIIEEDTTELCNSVEFLFKKENNGLYRANAVKYSYTFNYEDIFSKL